MLRYALRYLYLHCLQHGLQAHSPLWGMLMLEGILEGNIRACFLKGEEKRKEGRGRLKDQMGSGKQDRKENDIGNSIDAEVFPLLVRILPSNCLERNKGCH